MVVGRDFFFFFFLRFVPGRSPPLFDFFLFFLCYLIIAQRGYRVRTKSPARDSCSGIARRAEGERRIGE